MKPQDNLIIRNFLFHQVNPKRDPLWDPMDIALFERCIKYISNKYEVFLFEDLEEVKTRKIKKPLARDCKRFCVFEKFKS